jgi:hypothetical protein
MKHVGAANYPTEPKPKQVNHGKEATVDGVHATFRCC